jgi:hypothetical protein
MSKRLIDGKKAKGILYVTDILDSYSGFYLQQLELTNSRCRYRMFAGRKRYELQVTVRSIKNLETTINEKRELEALESTDGTELLSLKLLDERHCKEYQEVYIEKLLEVHKKTLIEELPAEDKGRTDAKRALDVAIKTLELLKDENFESYPILKLDNLLFKDGRIEFLSAAHNEVAEDDKDDVYCAPEVLRLPLVSQNKDKVKVYEWGMMVYHFAGKKTMEVLGLELKWLKCEEGMYGKFIDQIKAIELENDFDGKITKMLKEVLVKALDESASNRPSFSELYDLIRGFSKSL